MKCQKVSWGATEDGRRGSCHTCGVGAEIAETAENGEKTAENGFEALAQ